MVHRIGWLPGHGRSQRPEQGLARAGGSPVVDGCDWPETFRALSEHYCCATPRVIGDLISQEVTSVWPIGTKFQLAALTVGTSIAGERRSQGGDDLCECLRVGVVLSGLPESAYVSLVCSRAFRKRSRPILRLPRPTPKSPLTSMA